MGWSCLGVSLGSAGLVAGGGFWANDPRGTGSPQSPMVSAIKPGRHPLEIIRSPPEHEPWILRKSVRSLPDMMLLFGFMLPVHGRVRLGLTPSPGQDDSALVRRMGLRDEAFERGDVSDCAIHGAAASFFQSGYAGEGGLPAPPRPDNCPAPDQAFSCAVSGVRSTLIRNGLAVSAFGNVMVSTPRL